MPAISIVVVGDTQSGKTQLINRFGSASFSEGYTRTGFNKVEITQKIHNTDVKITVWDTSGLISYGTLRPLVYRDCSVVLICYSSGGLDGVKSWADEVRKSTNAPLVLVHTKNDEEAETDMEVACEICERIGAVNWETTSAKTGENIQTVFDLCTSAATVVPKSKIKRPSTLSFTSVNEPDTSSSNSPGDIFNEQDHLYENPDELTLPKLKRINIQKVFSIANETLPNIQENKDTKRKDLPNLRNREVHQSDNSDESRMRRSCTSFNSCVTSLSPTPSVTKHAVLRPHSSQSAQIRPSSLYRHSSNRLSTHRKLKAVSIPLSPNCDINQNRDKYHYSDTSSILSPTDSTASSIISSNLSMPPFRNSKYLVLPSPSSSSSSNAYQPFSPTSFQSRLSSDRESVSSRSATDSGFYSSGEQFHRTNHLRQIKSPNFNERYRVSALQDHIEEVEETCEEMSSGCSIFPTRPKFQISDKSTKLRSVKSPSSNRLSKKNHTKDRCSLM